MPLLDQLTTTAGEDLLPGRPLNTSDEETPSALDVVAAGLRQSNIVTSLYERHYEPDIPARDPTYDALDDIAGYEAFADRFTRSGSPIETQVIKRRIDQELSDRDVLRRAGGYGLAASIGAGVVDPVTLASMAVPAAPALAGASRFARIGAGIAANATLDIASEILLHQQQELRTVRDSAINVGASALLTGVFGTLATRIPKKEFSELEESVRKELNQGRPELYPEHKSGGSAAVKQTTIEEESIARGGQTIAKIFKQTNPILRTMQSASVSARRVAQRLVEIPFALEKNRAGIATPISVEARVRSIVDAGRYATVTILDELRQALKKTRGTTLSRGEFAEAVAGAMRRGDKADIPEVQRAAQRLREIINGATKAAQEVGALPEELTADFAESYFPRLYNVAKIQNERAAFERVLREHFTANPRQGAFELDAADIEEAVQRTVENITGARHGEAKLSGNVVPTAGPLKGRVLSVPDTILEPWLVSDTEHVMSSFLRKIVPHTEMVREFGTADMREALAEVADDYRRAKISSGEDAVRNNLDKEMGNTLRDLTALRDKVLGTYGAPADPSAFIVRAQRVLRSANYVRLLGGQVLSALPDIGRVMTAFGIPKTAAGLVKFATSPSFRKLAVADAKRLGTAFEMALDTRGASYADIGEEFVGSRADQIMQRTTNAFSRLTLQAPWNVMLKSVSSALAQDALLRAGKRARLSAFEKAQLASAGINEEMLKRITRQFDKFGVTESGLVRAHTDAWDDRVAATALEDYVQRQANLLVLTRGHGDVPLFLSSELGKTLLQFRSFTLAAANRLLIGAGQGLAAGDLKTASGLGAMLSFGVASYAVKEKIAGREIETEPSRLVAEAFDKSGLAPMVADIWDPLAYMTNASDFRFSRFSDRAPLESMLGPTWGAIGELTNVAHRVSDGELKEGDIHAVRKLLPFQNLFYTRRAFDALEGEVADATGATP